MKDVMKINRHSLKIYIDASIAQSGQTGFGSYILFNDKVCFEEGFIAKVNVKNIEVAELHALKRSLCKVYGSNTDTFCNCNIEVYTDNQTVLDCFINGSEAKTLPKKTIKECNDKIKSILKTTYNNSISFNKVESSENLAHDLAYNAAVNNKEKKGKTLTNTRTLSKTIKNPIIKTESNNTTSKSKVLEISNSPNPEKEPSSEFSKKHPYLYELIKHLTESLSEQKNATHTLEKEVIKLKTLLEQRELEIENLKSISKKNMDDLLSTTSELINSKRIIEHNKQQYNNTIKNLTNELETKNKLITKLETQRGYCNLEDTEIALTSLDNTNNNSFIDSKSTNRDAIFKEKILNKISSFFLNF